MSSKLILTILSYTVLKLVHFATQCRLCREQFQLCFYLLVTKSVLRCGQMELEVFKISN